MAGVRKDYLLNQIDLLRQFVARLLNKREPAGLDEALQLAFHLQEKLFPLPPADFLRLDVDQQVAALNTGESKADGQEKCLNYARLLKETATLYDLRGRSDLAAGARQLALHLTLAVALNQPVAPESVDALVDELQSGIDLENLHPPVRELLAAYEQQA